MSLVHDSAFLAHFAQCKVSAKQQVNSLIDAIYAKVLFDLELWLNKQESNEAIKSEIVSDCEENVTEKHNFPGESPDWQPTAPEPLRPTHSITPHSSSHSIVKDEIDYDEVEVDSRVIQHDSNEQSTNDLGCSQVNNEVIVPTSSHEISSNHFNQHFVNMDNSHQQPNGSLHLEPVSNQQISRHSQPMTIKEEIEPMSTDQTESVSYAPVSTEHSSNNLPNSNCNNNDEWDNSQINFPDPEMPQPRQLVHIKHNEHDEEECDCEECVDGGMEAKEKDEQGESDGGQRIEDDQEDEESSRHVKRQRMDSTQPNNSQTEVTKQSPIYRCRIRQIDQTPPNEVNHHDNAQEGTSGSVLSRQPKQRNNENTQDKQIITVSLRCLQSGCTKVFAEDELNDHMTTHSIGPFRCVVKDCKQSFVNSHILGDHIKEVHQHTTQWHCDKCLKHFTKYNLLSVHTYQQHQHGHFQCSFPACTFAGEYRGKVYSHYKRQHKPTVKCQHSGCNYRASNSVHLKQHQRIHSGIKPYRCKWPECDYAAIQKGDTIKHIRRMHIAPKPGSVQNGAQLDPSDYVEVMHELL